MRTIDLFAGIGGIRLGFEQALGTETVFASEIDKFARRTYLVNFPDTPLAGDIRDVDPDDIPDHDILLAGFPCPTFSLAGVSKLNSMGRPHGFEDKTRGTLFFDVARILDAKRPRAFMLENVKNLTSHDKGRTFRVISETLSELGYDVHHKVIDARHWVPQHRERIYIVGFRDDTPFSWDGLDVPADETRFSDVAQQFVLSKYTLSDKLWGWLQDHAEKHASAGHGFGYGLVYPDSVTRTISARYGKDGSEALVWQDGKNPRKLTPRECARLQGFPDTFRIPVSDTQAYRQFGNSVCVPVIAAVAKLMGEAMSGIQHEQTGQMSLF